MKKLLIGLMIISPVLFVGCASAPDNKVEIPLDSDPRVGEEVRGVCFAREMDGWQDVDNDRKAIILRMNNGETFKLKLLGGCNPAFANSDLAIIDSTKEGCFTPRDKVRTGSDPRLECIVTSIHKWDAKAVSETEKAEQ